MLKLLWPIGLGVEGDGPVLESFALLGQLPTASVGVSDSFLALEFLLLNQFGFECSADVRWDLGEGVVALGKQGIKDQIVLGEDRVERMVVGNTF